MLIIGGLVLDKLGVRFTGIVSCLLCVIGIGVKYWAMTSASLTGNMTFLGNEMPRQVFWASMGFATFGVGAEVAGVTVTKSIAKWFKGYEMALAMGVQVAISRMGQGAAMLLTPSIAEHFGNAGAVVLTGLLLLIFGTLLYIIFTFYDKKLDKQISAEGINVTNSSDEDEFKWKDVLDVLKNPAFWMIAFLCVLFYSAVFPFQKYASDLMVNKFGVNPAVAGQIPSVLPFGCIILTPLFGTIYDNKGHGADLMIVGAVIIATVHIFFAMPFINKTWMAYILMAFLGIGFALLPSAMWPSVAKIIPAKQLGTAMSLTFYIQNIGLWGVPLLIGYVLNKYCITGSVLTAEGLTRPTYNYTFPSIIFASFGIISIIIAIGVKILDKKKHYGLQIANIQH
jgi:MFS family permease